MKQLSAEAVVTNSIRLTELLLTKNQVSWKEARDGIEIIKEDSARKWPTDSVMIRARFDAWMCAQHTRCADPTVSATRRDVHPIDSHIDQAKVNRAHASLRLGRGS